jgi:hypothetical protein
VHDDVITCYPSTRNIFYQQLPFILIASEDVESQWFFPAPIKTNHQSKKKQINKVGITGFLPNRESTNLWLNFLYHKLCSTSKKQKKLYKLMKY